jgi:acetolactate synthase-1/2/3 large subunit
LAVRERAARTNVNHGVQIMGSGGEDNPARRRFLTTTLIGAAGIVPPVGRVARAAAEPPAQRPSPLTRAPWLRAAETQSVEDKGAGEPAASLEHIENPGSDFMVDVLRSLAIDYVAVMPGSTFRGLHESLVNYGDSGARAPRPEIVVCTHEEAAAGIAHGYV